MCGFVLPRQRLRQRCAVSVTGKRGREALVAVVRVEIAFARIGSQQTAVRRVNHRERGTSAETVFQVRTGSACAVLLPAVTYGLTDAGKVGTVLQNGGQVSVNTFPRLT